MPDYSSAGATAGGLLGGPIGAGLGGLLGGAIGLFTGASQKRKARNILNQPYPEYKIPTEVTQAASEGLPSEQYAQAMRNIQRQQSAAISQAQDRRSGLGAIGKTQQLSNDAMLNLDVANAKARQQNQLRLGTYRDKAWDWNVKNKYNRDFNYGMNLLGAGNQNFSGGLDRIGGGLGLLAGGGAFKGLFGRGSSTATSRTGDYTQDDSLPQ